MWLRRRTPSLATKVLTTGVVTLAGKEGGEEEVGKEDIEDKAVVDEEVDARKVVAAVRVAVEAGQGDVVGEVAILTEAQERAALWQASCQARAKALTWTGDQPRPVLTSSKSARLSNHPAKSASHWMPTSATQPRTVGGRLDTQRGRPGKVAWQPS